MVFACRSLALVLRAMSSELSVVEVDGLTVLAPPLTKCRQVNRPPPAVVEIDEAVDMIGDEDDGGIHAASFVLRVGHLSVVASSWLQLLWPSSARPSSFLFGN